MNRDMEIFVETIMLKITCIHLMRGERGEKRFTKDAFRKRTVGILYIKIKLLVVTLLSKTRQGEEKTFFFLRFICNRFGSLNSVWVESLMCKQKV